MKILVFKFGETENVIEIHLWNRLKIKFILYW